MAYDENGAVILGRIAPQFKALAWRLLEMGPFSGVVAVTGRRLVPAAIVTRELEIRHIETALSILL